MKHIIDTEQIDNLKKYDVEVLKDDVEKCVSLVDLRALIENSPQADDVRKDAERWRTFREIASEEMCYALCGNSNADNDELDQAIDQARKI